MLVSIFISIVIFVIYRHAKLNGKQKNITLAISTIFIVMLRTALFWILIIFIFFR